MQLSDQECQDIANFLFDGENVEEIKNGTNDFEGVSRAILYESPGEDSSIKQVQSVCFSFSDDEYSSAQYEVFLVMEDKFLTISYHSPSYCDDEWDCMASGFDVHPIAELDVHLDKSRRQMIRGMLGKIMSDLPSDVAPAIMMEELACVLDSRMKPLSI